jgi:hypothetical protein
MYFALLSVADSMAVDTSYLYSLVNESGAPSIRDISEQIFKLKLPDTHDSVLDAQAALKAAAYLAKNGPSPPINRSSADRELDSLLCHKIPTYLTEEQIRQMLIESTHIVPVDVSPIIRGSGADAGKATIKFLSAKHADLAFEAISGPVRPEKSNREQKRVYLKGGGYICIRKN